MTAKEAREITENTVNWDESTLDFIYSQIKRVARTGGASYSFTGKFSKELIEILRTDGFRMNSSRNNHREFETLISW